MMDDIGEDIAEDEMIEVIGPEDIPRFTNEDEEDAFWSAHYIGKRFLERVGPVPEERRPANLLRQAMEARKRQ
ncbi:MAG: hypothetical protein ACR2PL_20255 [Dehalococcoidia bacterium]